RHTRSYGDWSSDVCSSDLLPEGELAAARAELQFLWSVHARITEGSGGVGQTARPTSLRPAPGRPAFRLARRGPAAASGRTDASRSEERRVGEEWDCEGAAW